MPSSLLPSKNFGGRKREELAHFMQKSLTLPLKMLSTDIALRWSAFIFSAVNIKTTLKHSQLYLFLFAQLKHISLCRQKQFDDT